MTRLVIGNLFVLTNDEDGQKTREIKKNGTNVQERRDEMLTVFLKQSTPTWQKVIII